MIKFYFHPSPNPLKIALYLEETGEPYELIPVDTRKGEQHADAFKTINPNAKTPAMLDDDIRVFDSNAMLLYLAEKMGKFVPANTPSNKAEMYSWLMFVATGIAEAIGSAFLLRVDGKRYFVTAAHVLDLNQQATLYVAGSNALEPIAGIAGITRAPASGRVDDKFDFAFMELSDDFSSRLGVDAFIDANEISQNRGTLDGRCFMALGYPASRNKSKPISVTGTHVRGKAWAYSATTYTDEKVFNVLGASQDWHLLLKFAKKSKAFTGEVTASITPHGASGGVLIDLGRIDPQSFSPTAQFTPRLAGILIEHHAASKAILAVKIQAIIEAIRKL